jgi:hypothetical protein
MTKHTMSVFPGKLKQILKFPDEERCRGHIAIQFETCNLKLRATGDKGELVKQHDTQMALPVKPLGTDVGIFCVRLTPEQLTEIKEALDGI